MKYESPMLTATEPATNLVHGSHGNKNNGICNDSATGASTVAAYEVDE